MVVKVTMSVTGHDDISIVRKDANGTFTTLLDRAKTDITALWDKLPDYKAMEWSRITIQIDRR